MQRLCVFGATGGTGRMVVQEALRRRWNLVAFSRTCVPDWPDGVEARVGNVLDLRDVAGAIEGAHAVACVLGPRAPYSDVFCADATRTLVAAMEFEQQRRLVCVTGAMIGEASNRTRPMELMRRLFRRRRPQVAADRAMQEAVVQASRLDWTIIKPPRLTNGPAAGHYQAGPALPVGMTDRLSRADLASCVLDLIEQDRFIQTRVFVRA